MKYKFLDTSTGSSGLPSYAARILASRSEGFSRNDDVRFPCGSLSIAITLVPRLDARIFAKLKAMVVLPTPPFWFAIAMVIIVLGFNIVSANYL